MSEKGRTSNVNGRAGVLDSLPLFASASVVPPQGSITGGTKYSLNSSSLNGPPTVISNSKKLINQKKVKVNVPSDCPLIPLTAGVDGLLLYVSGQLQEEWEILLEWQRERAGETLQVNGDGLAESPLPPLFGAGASMPHFGARGYAFLVDSDDYAAKFQRRSKVGDGFNPRPSAFLRISAAALWRLGWRAAVQQANDWLLALYEPGAIIRISRVDICCDFQGYDAGETPVSHFVTKADLITPAYESGTGKLRQLSAGRSNKVRATIYHKSKEIAASGKEWMRQIWEGSGYKTAEKVWRLEFQLGAEFLREREVNTVTDLLHRLPEIWAYCLNWFSLREPSATDTNRSRWDEAVVWRAFRAFLTGSTPPIAARVKHGEQVVSKVKRLEDALMGHLTSLMVLYAEEDVERQLGRALRNWVKRREPYGDGVSQRLSRKRLLLAGLEGAALV